MWLKNITFFVTCDVVVTILKLTITFLATFQLKSLTHPLTLWRCNYKISQPRHPNPRFLLTTYEHVITLKDNHYFLSHLCNLNFTVYLTNYNEAMIKFFTIIYALCNIVTWICLSLHWPMIMHFPLYCSFWPLTWVLKITLVMSWWTIDKPFHILASFNRVNE